jgi:hypothetical protein
MRENQGFAVGLINKTIKYYCIDDNGSSNLSSWSFILHSQTTIDNFKPQKMCFYDGICFVSYDDATKLYLFEREKHPQLMDVITKPYGRVLDFRFSTDRS